MKYYETNYEEYVSSYENYNLHPEWTDNKTKFPKNISEFKNLIVYGPSGVGKYTQVLSILHAYSPSKLKYDKKISVTYEKQEKKTKSTIASSSSSKTNLTSLSSMKEKEKSKEKEKENHKKKTLDVIPIKKTEKKQEYTYRISDIHYEIDMATLGCNSKLLWHDLFFQIIDIISVSFHSLDKSDKVGIIVCKNFHTIHNELLDIFYSYMRHPLHPFHIQIKFILITEHIGFIPDNIMNACKVISVKRPSKENYIKMAKLQTKSFSCFMESNRVFPRNFSDTNNGYEFSNSGNMFYDKTTRSAVFPKNKTAEILEELDSTSITNAKEIHSFSWLRSSQEIPVDVFNMINDALLDQILHPETLKITDLRNNLYELLIYNVDVAECVWYIFTSLIHQGCFEKKEHIMDILNDIFVFFKYYNNNYRSIYHLESIILCMLNKIHYSSSSLTL